MSVGKLTGSTSREAAVRPNGIVVESKCFNRALGIREADEPTLVEAFVPQAAVEAFDEVILCRLSRLDELQRHTALVRPLIDGFTAKLWAFVTHDDLWVPANKLHLV